MVIQYDDDVFDTYLKARTRRGLYHLPLSDVIDAEFDKDGNFTYCLVRYSDMVAMGAAKRRVDDTENEQVGRDVALTRALVKLHNKLISELVGLKKRKEG